MISTPAATSTSPPPLEGRGTRHGWLRRLLVREWHLLLFVGATMVALLSPATYDREVRRAVGEIGVGVDVLIISRDEFERRSTVPGTPPHRAKTEGRLLHDASA